MNNENNKDYEGIKNTIRLVLAGVILISIIAGVYLHVLGGKKHFTHGPIGNTKLGKTIEKTIEPDGDVENLVIDIDFGNVEITSGEKLSVYYNMPEKLEPEVSLADGILSVKSKGNVKSTFGDINNSDCELVVELPSNTKLSDANIAADLGDMSISELAAKSLTIKLSCGDLDLSEVKANNISIDNNMGDVCIANAVSECCVIEQAAGDVEVINGQIKKIQANSELGNVEFGGDFDEITAKCSMGDIKLDTEKSESKMKLDLDVGLGSIEINGKKKD